MSDTTDDTPTAQLPVDASDPLGTSFTPAKVPLRADPLAIRGSASSLISERRSWNTLESLDQTAGRPQLHNTDANATASEPRQRDMLSLSKNPKLPSSEESRGDSRRLPSGGLEAAPAVRLHRSSYIVLVVSIYASLASIAWILICFLTFKPLTTGQYGFHNRYDPGLGDSSSPHVYYVRSEGIYRAARTVQAVISVLTIPLTSAVCSAAAVVFVQTTRNKRNLTLRQTITLADKGWTDPTTIARIVTGRGKKLSSSLLMWALLLNLLGKCENAHSCVWAYFPPLHLNPAQPELTTEGASITPLQALFLSQRTIKTPTREWSKMEVPTSIVDIPNKLGYVKGDGDWGQNNLTGLVSALTRTSLKSTSNTTPQPLLWQESLGCSSSNQSRTERCFLDTPTLGNLSQLSSPYLAQLPVGYHTGLIKQHILRINSTVKWENVSQENTPSDCGKIANSFYARYANATPPGHPRPRGWSIEACMPSDQSVSPWKATYNRQDFRETLYLNISLQGYVYSGHPISGGSFRIASETTAGYFELPNYMNGGQPGPLIDGNPDDADHCGSDCVDQSGWNPEHDYLAPRALVPESNLSNFQSNGSLGLTAVANAGPLLTVAIALFGYDSFIPARLNHPGDFIVDESTWPADEAPWKPSTFGLACMDQKPMSSLLLGPDRDISDECVEDTTRSPEDLDWSLSDYLQSFYLFKTSSGRKRHIPERSANAFASAVFLATQSWLTSDLAYARRRVHVDPGADTVIPTISRAGLILISCLLVLYIACIFGLALYSASAPRWTNQLDAFAMMRVGAAAYERIQLHVGFETMAIEALDELPGMIGDATGGEGDFGALGMSGSTPLNGLRRYRCYKGDEDQLHRRNRRGRY